MGDLTRPDTLTDAVAGVDAVVFTHGSGGDGRAIETVDYGASATSSPPSEPGRPGSR